MDDKKEKIQKLKTYFEQRDDVVMAFVFGSQAKGYARTVSDWDVGVYFTPESKQELELEIDREYPEAHRIWSKVERIVESEVDLVVLNRAAAVVADSILNGIPIVIKDRALWLRFMLAVTRDAIDFRETAREYAEIYWRSSSLTKEDAYEFDRRLLFIDSEMSALSEFFSFSWLEYQQNNHKRREVERIIENIMNAVIDAAKIVLASQKWSPMPQTYKEIVKTAGLMPPFSSEVMERLATWADLRNLLAHEYLDYRWKDIEDFLRHSEPHIRKFLNDAQTFLKEQRP